MKHQLTLKFIEETFDKYNKEYWNGSLRKPKFEICHTKSLLGQFCFGGGQWKMRISDMYDRSKEDYINTILHESIHLYIRQNKIKDTNGHHGREFYKEADRLNRHGWYIARTDSVEGIGLSIKGNVTYKVAAFLDKEGRYFLMCMNPNKVDYFKKRFNQYADFYKEYIMFTSKDDVKYATFSKCTKNCRGRFISKADYEKLKAENPTAYTHVSTKLRDVG